MFDRDPLMAQCQIMNYDTDANDQWCFLVGLYAGAPGQINSRMQLYNFERRQQQMLEGYSACFVDMPVTDSAPGHVNNLFAFCEKKSNETAQRLHIMEIGPSAPGAAKFKVTAEIALAADA